MLGKKCSRCGRRVKKDFSFCPTCGKDMRTPYDAKDFGMLGRSDEDDFEDLGIKLPPGINLLFKNLVKQLDKQFKELDKISREEMREIRDADMIRGFKPIRKGFSISISSKDGRNPSIKINEIGKEAKVKRVENVVPEENMKKKQESIKKMKGLPREEAETRVRRLSNKIIYEIELPGVKSVHNIILNKLENSIEIKALAKGKVLVKLLPISLPIIGYKLEKEKLILELKN